ncbi:DUF1883 domain-containing protein [Morganella morganii]|uniref:DUF1883 domain-containing protein n=1 Tax=Morganella morganii TaxID=582 RepID=UPI001BDB5DD4|nr:DUF1883 domain-containing protein [Morganella morganii]EMB6209871.1 DUF1883 domain-containing protein [Morganella morganii]MBT0362770.1 DUF1883 domain-containing protein [Morganella morganii subsp. morganii]
MSFIHAREHANQGDIVSVQCNHQTNVLVMDDTQFNNYKNWCRTNYYGGFYERFPANVPVPSTGYWNVVLALPAGHRTNIRYSINILN